MKVSRKQEGFTIIEVMIVLAIAGLIIVVALIAIPQLQRNQRNNARQSILSRISTEIGNYAGNNNGQVPSNQDELDDVETRYLSDVNLEDPRTGVQMPLTLGTDAVDAVPGLIDSAPADDGAGGTTGDLGIAYYQASRSCDGETLIAGSAREYALYTVLEGGAIYCLDNS